MDDQRLAQLLLEKKLITPPQLRNAVNLQKQTGGSLRQIVVKLNYVKPADLNALIAEVEHVNVVQNILPEKIHKEAMKKIPKRVIEKYNIAPLYHEEDEGTILLAMEDPKDFQAIEEVQFLTGMRVEPALASRSEIIKALNRYYNPPEEPSPPPAETSLEEKIASLFQNHSTQDILKALLKVGIEKKLFSLEEISENV